MPGRASIVTSILAVGTAAARDAIAGLPAGSDPIELRADRMTAAEVGDIVSSVDRELIVTVRRRVDGGTFDGGEQTRVEILRAALTAGARWIDVEWGSEAESLAGGGAAGRIILSDHGAVCEADELRRRLDAMSVSPAARLKIVARADDPGQIPAIRDLLKSAPDDRLCAFALGESGALTRLLAASWGSWGTYASLASGAETAPGQFSVEELRKNYDVLAIRDSTSIVALAGRAILPGSPSPAMHNAGYRALGMDRVYVPLQTADWDAVIRVSDALGFAGLAVTLPFKGAAADHCARCDDLSKRARAVNTVVMDGDEAVGANTDGPAAVGLLGARGITVEHTIDVLGAGGTGRAIAAALAMRGHHVRVWSRDPDPELDTPRIEHRAHETRRPGESDWVVNATPLRDATLIGTGAPARRGVLEVVYGPPETTLERRARRAGLVVIDGLDLLVAQAELQFELHTGRKPPQGLFAAVGQRHLESLG